jgi:signal transduction histidine kinase
VAVVVAAVGVLGARVALRRRRSRRAVEASRNRAFADLLTAVRQRDEALAQASHDLKTPLTALKGQAQLLQRLLRSTETPDADRMRAGLATIDAAATAAAERVDRLVEGADSKPAKGTSGR